MIYALRPPVGQLHRQRTRYQDIRLTSDRRGLFLVLNGSPQVHSSEERPYHEAIATVPMMLARKARDIAILGGGDGLAARNILDFPDVRSCTLVELDGGVIDLCTRNPYWRALNHGSLNDRRLSVVVGDGIRWMLEARASYDVIIHDLEMSFTDQPTAITVDRCYRYFMNTFARLRPGGVWVLTVADDTPESLPDGIFEATSKELPTKLKHTYEKLDGAIPKTRLLLEFTFPHVRSLTISPKVLGTHTTFYISNAPMKRFHRPSPLPLTIDRLARRMIVSKSG